MKSIRSDLALLLLALALLTGCHFDSTALFKNSLFPVRPPNSEKSKPTKQLLDDSYSYASISDAVSAIDPNALTFSPDNTSIEFVGAAGPMRQPGSFEQFSGTCRFEGKNITNGTLDLQIDMKSIKTNIGLLTRHLRSKDFFDVEQYPTSRFESANIRPTDKPNYYLVSGDLTIHGTTNHVQLPARIQFIGDQLHLEMEFIVRQSDYGMERGAKKAKDEVPVTVKAKIG